MMDVVSYPDQRVELSFFERRSWQVAPDLIGTILVLQQPAGQLALQILETEAYAGSEDPASHAYRGPSARNASMFLGGGHLYVYRSYGIHLCMNIVTGQENSGEGVLIRAGQALQGEEIMRQRRGGVFLSSPDAKGLLNGPGKVGQALGLSLTDNGRNLTTDPKLFLLPRPTDFPVETIHTTERIGISKAVETPWRWVATPSQPGR